jgi:3-oxoacyl-[acyl-carrier protein] reductase
VKNVLITGASKGIGRETAILLAKRGFNVVINYNNSEKDAIDLQNKLIDKGYSALAVRADVSKRIEVKKMVSIIEENYGTVNILINNAAVSYYNLFTDISESEWDRIFEVNVKGVFNCTQEVVKNMINDKWGKIINISSIWGISGASCEVHYSTTKAAVIGFTKSLAKELGPSNINVNCVAPGIVDTDMMNDFSENEKTFLKNEIPLGNFASPNDIAKIIYFLLKKESSYITGQVISPNGGYLI